MKRRILIVDGSRTVRRMLEQQLTRRGYRVDTAGSANQALAKLIRAPYDLVSTGLQLPDEPGTAFAAALRELRGQRHVPLVILSGDEDAARRLDPALRVAAVLDKRAGPAVLATQLQEILDQLPATDPPPPWPQQLSA